MENATTAGSSQSNISRILHLKRQKTVYQKQIKLYHDEKIVKVFDYPDMKSKNASHSTQKKWRMLLQQTVAKVI